MNKVDLIKSKLDYITILDFYNNYDKSEFERVVANDSKEITRVKTEILDILKGMYDTEKYDFTISCNFVSINEIVEKRENSMITKVKEKIFSNNFEKLPYSWIMGRKVTKSVMQNAIKNME